MDKAQAEVVAALVPAVAGLVAQGLELLVMAQQNGIPVPEISQLQKRRDKLAGLQDLTPSRGSEDG